MGMKSDGLGNYRSFLGEVTRAEVTACPDRQARFRFRAKVLRLPAHGPEPAPGRRVHGARHFPFEPDDLPVPAQRRVGDRNRGQQRLRGSRFITCAWIETSSADTGSSQMITFGRNASALAIPIR